MSKCSLGLSPYECEDAKRNRFNVLLIDKGKSYCDVCPNNVTNIYKKYVYKKVRNIKRDYP